MSRSARKPDPDARTDARLGSFATYILHNPSFQWLLQTNSLRVQALGVQFDGVALQKTVSFLAFNGRT